MAGLVMPLYLPALFISTGTGILIPVLPIYLRDIGLSYTLVTTVLAAFGVGALAAQIPIGAAVSRLGERTVMAAAVLLIGVSVALLGFTAVTLALVALRIVAGIGSTGWLLSRHSFITSAIPSDVRGRVASTFGGVSRLALFIGPVVGGFVAERWGFEAAFTVTGLLTATGIIPLLATLPADATPDPATRLRGRGALRRVIRDHRRPLAVGGLVQLGVVAVREGRLAVIPLLGAALGLDVREVGFLVAIGAASELVLFPVAGMLMDRFGRLTALLPSLVLLGIGLLVAAAAASAPVLVVAGVVVGLGNGLGSGTMLTIGADLAPPGDPSRFLSVIGTTRDTGRVLGPLMVGWLADTMGLSGSAAALAVVAFVTAGFSAGVLGDTSRYGRTSTDT
ncbi:MAG: MFS transporter [Acidimicrobiia bacterium]|nr:MFS transporter [Acidimicrobiia bacterium]